MDEELRRLNQFLFLGPRGVGRVDLDPEELLKWWFGTQTKDEKYDDPFMEKQQNVVNGFIRSVEKSLEAEIIPSDVNIICFQFYYVSMYFATKTGFYAISLEAKKKWKCAFSDTINTCANIKITSNVFEYGATLVT